MDIECKTDEHKHLVLVVATGIVLVLIVVRHRLSSITNAGKKV